MWTNTAGFEENEHTGGNFNHIVPMMPLPNHEVFYFHDIHAQPPAQPPSQPPKPAEKLESNGLCKDNGYCDSSGPECTHDPRIPPDSLCCPFHDLFR